MTNELGLTKLSSEERAYILKVATYAYEDYMMEKDAALMNIPFVKTFADKVSGGTMDLWRRQYHLAMTSATPDMAKYHQRLAGAVGQASGEGRVALEGVQRIIHHVHNVGKNPTFDPSNYGALGQGLGAH